jgi:hypothetical protein
MKMFTIDSSLMRTPNYGIIKEMCGVAAVVFGVFLGMVSMCDAAEPPKLLVRQNDDTQILKSPKGGGYPGLDAVIARYNSLAASCSNIGTNSLVSVKEVIDKLNSVRPESGQIKVEMTFTAGKLTEISCQTASAKGVRVAYRLNGSIASITETDSGKPDGVMLLVKDGGVLRCLWEMKQGKILGKVVVWNTAGDVVTSKEYTTPTDMEFAK